MKNREKLKCYPDLYKLWVAVVLLIEQILRLIQSFMKTFKKVESVHSVVQWIFIIQYGS